MLLRLMERFPIIITIGAALLGYVSGEMAVTDPAAQPWIDAHFAALHHALPISLAVLVVITGKLLNKRKEAAVTPSEEKC